MTSEGEKGQHRAQLGNELESAPYWHLIGVRVDEIASGYCRLRGKRGENRIWSGRSDSNRRPPEPHSGALPDCATPRPVPMLAQRRFFRPATGRDAWGESLRLDVGVRDDDDQQPQ